MKVIYIKEKNTYVLVESFTDLDFSGLSITPGAFWQMDKAELEKHMVVTDVHASELGQLVYDESKEQWEWHVFDKPKNVSELTW